MKITRAEEQLSSSETRRQDRHFALISEEPPCTLDNASRGTDQIDLSVVAPAKLRLLFIVTKGSLEHIYRRIMNSALATAEYLCLQKLVGIGSIHTVFISLLVRQGRFSAYMLFVWIFVNLSLPLKSLMDRRHSNCKVTPVRRNIEAATILTSSIHTTKSLRACDNLDSSNSGDYLVTPSLSSSPEHSSLQSRLPDSEQSPIRTTSPSSISLSSTKGSNRQLIQRLRKKLKCCRSCKITRKFCTLSAKVDSRSESVLQNPSMQTNASDEQINASDEQTLSNNFQISSHVLLNAKQQTSIDSQSKQEPEDSLTFTKVRQTTSKTTSAPNLSRKSGAATVWPISLVLVLSALSFGGRFSAIMLTSLTWIAFSLITTRFLQNRSNYNLFKSFSRTESKDQEMNKYSPSVDNFLVDCTSNDYKKKVVMEGILDRNAGSFCCFL